MKTCAKCGFQYDDEGLFCPECGEKSVNVRAAEEEGTAPEQPEVKAESTPAQQPAQQPVQQPVQPPIQPPVQPQPQYNYQQNYYAQPPVQQPAYQPPYPQFDAEDVAKTAAISALSYVPGIGIFFAIIALIVYPKSAYVKYHMNNALALIVFITIATFANIIPFLGQLVYGVAMIIYFVIAIMGIVRAKNGDPSPLPIVSGYKIIK